MGAADVVPGVSGGTIAFITGVYDELLDSIKAVNPRNLRLFFTGQFKAFFDAIHLPFLFSLLLGIGISILSLAKVITYALEHYPVWVWSFFFGLVLASSFLVSRDVKEWNWKTVLAFIIGTGAAYYITLATPAQTSAHPLFIFLCGAVAICAMILPGISGSFILVLMGKYYYIMEAIKSFDIKTILIFGAGCVLGITTFSHVLSYALKHFRNITLALLAGFMLGSLNKVWPWKATTALLSEGHEVSVETNIAPTDGWIWAVCLMMVGFIGVYSLELLSRRLAKQSHKNQA